MKNIIRLLAIASFSLAGTAFAQNTAPAPRSVEAQDARAQELAAPVTPNARFDPFLGNVTSTYAYVGSSYYQELTVDVYGFHFGTNTPAAISCQPRQSANYEYWYPDEFACQVITTSANTVRVRVRRLDNNSGWGQNLRLDFIVFDSVNN